MTSLKYSTSLWLGFLSPIRNLVLVGNSKPAGRMRVAEAGWCGALGALGRWKPSLKEPLLPCGAWLGCLVPQEIALLLVLGL